MAILIRTARESQGQVIKKEIAATRMENPPRIDEVLDDPVWETMYKLI